VIVQEPPYDLVVLSSDAEMKSLLERLIERGQAGRNCTRPFRWRCLRDPRRDTVWREPHRPLALFLEMDCSFLIVWDHQGSGREDRRPEDLEASAVECLTTSGVPRDRVLAVAFDPELEISWIPAWPRVKRIVADERQEEPPDDSRILAEAQRAKPRLRIPDDFDMALGQYPKELFEALVRLLRLRRSPPLYAKLGNSVSLRALKSESALRRIADAISTWLPPSARQ
jgi:hypothetical protein